MRSERVEINGVGDLFRSTSDACSDAFCCPMTPYDEAIEGTHLFEVHDVTMGISGEAETIRLRGRLLAPSEVAYPRIAARFRKLDYTALLRRDADVNLDVLLAMPGVLPTEAKSRLWLNALLNALMSYCSLDWPPFCGFWSGRRSSPTRNFPPLCRRNWTSFRK